MLIKVGGPKTVNVSGKMLSQAKKVFSVCSKETTGVRTVIKDSEFAGDLLGGLRQKFTFIKGRLFKVDTLTSDDKLLISRRKFFKSGDSFEALYDADGKTLIETVQHNAKADHGRKLDGKGHVYETDRVYPNGARDEFFRGETGPVYFKHTESNGETTLDMVAPRSIKPFKVAV